MKKYLITLMLIVAFVVPAFLFTTTQTTQASCTGTSVQVGKLQGTIAITSVDGEYYGDVYVSDETWNTEFPTNSTNENFEVVYKDDVFSGKGWSENFGWLDFTYGSSDQAKFISVADSDDWGEWDGVVDGLGNITLGTNDTWSGQAYSADYTGADGDDETDVLVGVVLNFDFQASEDLTFDDSGDCVERVDLFLDNARDLRRVDCPISTPTIRWSTENVSSCEASGDLWSSTGSKADNNSTGEAAAGSITESGTYATPQVITLTCIGDGSGNEVIGRAVAQCGETPTPPTPDVPVFQEV